MKAYELEAYELEEWRAVRGSEDQRSGSCREVVLGLAKDECVAAMAESPSAQAWMLPERVSR